MIRIHRNQFSRQLLSCLIIGLIGLINPAWGQVEGVDPTLVNSDTLSTDSLLAFSSLPDSTISDTLSSDSVLAISPPPDSTFQDSLTLMANSNAGPRFSQDQLDSIQTSSDLQASITYKATDSIVYDLNSGMLYLYNEADLTYEEFNLKAKKVRLAVDDQTLYAEGEKDKEGNDLGLPEFLQDGETYRARTVAYNFNTEKGRATGGRLVQEEAFILADVAKYQPDGSFHGKDGKYTSCDLDHPHYYIQSRKLKVLDNQQIITGPLNLVIGEFPIPVVVPFGFIPKNLNKKGKKNGFILPQYGNAQERGFFLRNLGYYYSINDYLDLRLDGDIYTRGGWRAKGTVNYNWLYNFNGTLSFNYGVTRFGEPTDSDFSRAAEWNLVWNHRQPIDPTASLNASVNISSSNRFQREISAELSDLFRNNLQSSIAFQKRFNNLPISINLSARHQQDLNKETVNMQLPELTVNVNRQTPFKSITNKNLTWLKQLGINYNVQARNSIETLPDSIFLDVLLSPNDSILIAIDDSTNELVRAGDFYNNGIRHTASASTGLKLFNYININPSFNYTEFWYLESTEKLWDEEAQVLVETQIPGFVRGYNYNGGVSANTNFYGLYKLNKDLFPRDITIRQRFSPSLSYTYRPDFSDPSFGFFEEVQTNVNGTTSRFSRFEDGIYGGPTGGESQSLGFSLASVLEAKFRRKLEEDEELDEDDDPYERISLIDNMSLRASYNLAADSFQLSNITANARTSLFKKKLNINASATFDPYVFRPDASELPFEQASARRQNVFLIQESNQLARMTRANISLSTSFRAKEQGNRDGKQQDIDEQEVRQVQRTYYEYYDFNIPWSVRLNYNFTYSKPGIDKPTLSSAVNVSGDVNFTENWKVAVTTGYDMINRKATTTSINISRPLHCWQMTFRWVPFGQRKSYSVVIAARSATLNALKLTKNDFWQDRFRAL